MMEVARTWSIARRVHGLHADEDVEVLHARLRAPWAECFPADKGFVVDAPERTPAGERTWSAMRGDFIVRLSLAAEPSGRALAGGHTLVMRLDAGPRDLVRGTSAVAVALQAGGLWTGFALLAAHTPFVGAREDWPYFAVGDALVAAALTAAGALATVLYADALVQRRRAAARELERTRLLADPQYLEAMEAVARLRRVLASHRRTLRVHAAGGPFRGAGSRG